ncbi:transposable element Tcb1 transposase [Trichonephila clavipes]|nr:transposable element Tcb1 transposase [Trichonephila clavipes]
MFMIHFVGVLISLLGKPLTAFHFVRTRRCACLSALNSINQSTHCTFCCGFHIFTNEVSVTSLSSAIAEEFAHVRSIGLDPKNLGGISNPWRNSLLHSDGEIGRRVGRIQTTVMRICGCWMQEGTTDRRGRSHPPQCTTSREDRQIVRMAVTDRSVTSRTIAQHIESVTHHSVSAHTIRRRLQQSGLSTRRPLLGLPLT